MPGLDPAQLRAAFDAQVRRQGGPAAAAGPGSRIVRSVAADGRGWSGITWSDLDDQCADTVIADQVSYFGLARPHVRVEAL